MKIKSLFRRITTSGHYMPEIDGLRFLAIFCVVYYHIYQFYVLRAMPTGLQGVPAEDSILHHIFHSGGRGVELFFVISGFILGLPFANQYLNTGKPVALGKYFIRRLTRLEPPYLLIMAGFFILQVIPVHPSFQAQDSAGAAISRPELTGSFFASALYLHNILFAQKSFINGVAWSLEVEVQFYIMAPLLARIFLLQPVTRYITVGAFCVALSLVQNLAPELLFGSYMPTRYHILGSLQFFLAGFLLAELYLNKDLTLRWPVWLEAFVGLALLAFILWVPFRAHHATGGRLGLMVSIFAFYYLTIKGRFWRRAFSLDWIAIIGGMVYTIYLVHFPVMVLAGKFTRHIVIGESFLLNFGVQFAFISAAILAVSSVIFLLLEKPCMNPKWPAELADWLRVRRPAPKREEKA